MWTLNYFTVLRGKMQINVMHIHTGSHTHMWL